eukprot:m.5089 g.5089  ORF g.5089 m.5089 type:complete len:118 (-) comp7402_c0_seq1:173-526(-)
MDIEAIKHAAIVINARSRPRRLTQGLVSKQVSDQDLWQRVEQENTQAMKQCLRRASSRRKVLKSKPAVEMAEGYSKDALMSLFAIAEGASAPKPSLQRTASTESQADDAIYEEEVEA